MAQTGRCWYCGSEDVEDYADGSHECLECGTTWGGRQYTSYNPNKMRYKRHTKKQQKPLSRSEITKRLMIAIPLWVVIIFMLIATCNVLR